MLQGTRPPTRAGGTVTVPVGNHPLAMSQSNNSDAAGASATAGTPSAVHQKTPTQLPQHLAIWEGG